MKKSLAIVLSMLMLLSVFAVAFADGEPEVIEVGVESSLREGAVIPAYITVPADLDENELTKLVVMIHGHGGNHNEWGGYDAISNGLAANGAVVATLDFPGCGASTESFQLNTMSNMMNDVLDVIDYVCENYAIGEVDAFGYSMGGRIVLQILAEGLYTFDAVELVAPAEDTEDMKNLFGGAEAWETMKAEANENGFVVFTTIYGQVQELSAEWFAELEAWPDGLAEAAAENYDGPVMVLYAVNDEAVSPFVSQAVADVFDAPVVNTYVGGHSYSFYCDDAVTVAVANGCSMAWFLNVAADVYA